jgi:purine-nucleoside/S-methyl-5'-thioadenosine phosphorylase / adenosine deaminase
MRHTPPVGDSLRSRAARSSAPLRKRTDRSSYVVRWHGEPPTHLTLAPLEAAGVRHAFTTRHHGSFAVDRPGPALAALGVVPGRLRFARQVHGAACLVADAAAAGSVGEADALLTTVPGVPLAIMTADCLAIVLADPAVPALGVAHAGWRGTVAGIAGRLVATLAQRAGARPERLTAAIGPSIGPCCYEVDEPVIGPLRAAFPESSERWARPRSAGKWWLDLWQANADQLVAAGVPPGAITNPRLCTSCRADLFFSYRREGRGGRLAAVATLGAPRGR